MFPPPFPRVHHPRPLQGVADELWFLLPMKTAETCENLLDLPPPGRTVEKRELPFEEAARESKIPTQERQELARGRPASALTLDAADVPQDFHHTGISSERKAAAGV